RRRRAAVPPGACAMNPPRLVLDPLETTTGGDALSPWLAPGREAMDVIAALCLRPDVAGVVPDRVFLEAYAYELLERIRVRAASAAPREEERFPFWPRCLFEAAEVRVHAARELEAMLPPLESARVVLRDDECVARAARTVLGAVRFPPERYTERLI